MDFSRWNNFYVVLVLILFLTFGVFVFSESNKNISAFSPQIVFEINKQIIQNNPTEIIKYPEKLSNPPKVVKAVYVTGYSASRKEYLNYLSEMFKKTEINAVVVDIKGSDGFVNYSAGTQEVKNNNLSRNLIRDINSLVNFFHDQNIYVIGRIAVFEDPVFAKAHPELALYNIAKTEALNSTGTVSTERVLWQDNNRLAWMDPSSKDVWDYNINLAKDAFLHGFDEINFDYIRFATDGDMQNIGYPFYNGVKPRAEVINEFFKYTRAQLPGEKISADLFGLTTVNEDDMGIGQLITNTFENYDFIAPMVYPSHYADGFIGFANPAEYPYEVIKYSLLKGVAQQEKYLKARTEEISKKEEFYGTPAAESNFEVPVEDLKPIAKFRPWIQDFNMGADYTADMIKQEIKAVEDSLGENYSGFMLWNPSNIYTTDAVLK